MNEVIVRPDKAEYDTYSITVLYIFFLTQLSFINRLPQYIL